MAIFLSDREVRDVADAKEAIEAVRIALKDYGLGVATNHPRRWIGVEGGIFRIMSASSPTLGVVGSKEGMWMSSEETGKTSDIERRTELVCLYSMEDCRLLAVINSPRLNEIRTAAAAAVAADELSRPDAKVVGVIGSGPHALAQVEMLMHVRELEGVRIFSRSAENRARAGDYVRSEFGLDVIVASSIDEAVDGADIVVEAVFSRTPVLSASMIGPGTHINSIGSSFGGKQVLEDGLLAKGDPLVVDFKEQALLDTSGDIVGPMLRGVISYESVRSLGEVVAGVARGRGSAGAVTIYKSLGMGLFDVAVAASVFNSAMRLGVGTSLATL